MITDPYLAKGIFIFLALLTIGITAYLSFREKKIDQSESLIYFTPFIATCSATAFLIFAYGIVEFDTTIFDPSEAFSALENHGFISATLKFFVAGAAISIAWHRSLVSNKQINLQTNSNNMSNFYSIQEHIKDEFKSEANSIYPKYLTLNNNGTIFKFLFSNAMSGNFNPSSGFIEIAKKLEQLESDLMHTVESLNRLLYEFKSPYSHNYQIKFGLYHAYINHCSTLLDSDEFYELNRKIIEINNAYYVCLELLIISMGLKTTNDFTDTDIGDPFRNNEIKQNIFIYLEDLILHCPINEDCIKLFNYHFHLHSDSSFSDQLSILINPRENSK